MNKVILIGRVTASPELRYTNNNKAFTRFTIAVNRNFKNENGDTKADFINLVAWDSKAETICKYVKKGNRIAAFGRIQTGSYDKADGTKGYLTDVIINELEFLENKLKEDKPAPEYDFPNSSEEDPFTNFGNEVVITEDDLPF